MKVKLLLETHPWRNEEKELELTPDAALVLRAACDEKNWARKAIHDNKVGAEVSVRDSSSNKEYVFTLTDDIVKAWRAAEYSLGGKAFNWRSLNDALKANVAQQPSSASLMAASWKKGGIISQQANRDQNSNPKRKSEGSQENHGTVLAELIKRIKL